MTNEDILTALYGTFWPIVAITGVTARFVQGDILEQLGGETEDRNFSPEKVRDYNPREAFRTARRHPYFPRNLGR